MTRIRSLLGIVLLVVTTTVVVAPAASASSTKCDSWAITKDYQGSICLEVYGTGLYTSGIYGDYNGNPTHNTMQLYVNGTKVESWVFQYSDIQHRFKTGYHHTWPRTTKVHMCLPFVYAVGTPCTPDISIHA